MLAELADAVRSRRVSAFELVTESLARIERRNPALNAVTLVRGEQALEEARVLDERGSTVFPPNAARSPWSGCSTPERSSWAERTFRSSRSRGGRGTTCTA